MNTDSTEKKRAEEKAANQCKFIGMLHAPVNTILSAPSAWRENLSTGENPLTVKTADWKLFGELENNFGKFLRPGLDIFFRHADDEHLFQTLEEEARKFSFISFLVDHVLHEAKLYCLHGADMLMLENIAAPYFVRDRQPVAIVSIMSLLAKHLREDYSDKPIGLQILAFSDDLAMAIALNHGFQFIRSESALFAGLRPEGPTQNHGNLATLYTMRNRWLTRHPGSNVPQVFVDLHKKHTLFPPGLTELDFWMDNLLFQKIEGAILSGHVTGKPIRQNELHRLRQAIDKLERVNQTSYRKPQLLIGSGVSPENIVLCRHYSDAVIVGSSLKKNGYWENPLDEDRLKVFLEQWNKSI